MLSRWALSNSRRRKQRTVLWKHGPLLACIMQHACRLQRGGSGKEEKEGEKHPISVLLVVRAWFAPACFTHALTFARSRCYLEVRTRTYREECTHIKNIDSTARMRQKYCPSQARGKAALRAALSICEHICAETCPSSSKEEDRGAERPSTLLRAFYEWLAVLEKKEPMNSISSLPALCLQQSTLRSLCSCAI
jgi:hypothetical protein